MTIKQQGGIFGRNPSFNEVEVSDLTVTSVTVTDEILFQGDSTGKVEQNKSSGRQLLELRSSSSGLGGGSGINLYGGGDSSFPDHVRIWGSSEALRIDDSNNTSIYGNLVISTSGKGIDFSATAGTGTSELFDDYEEGTWTPVVADSSSGGNTGTAATAQGEYTKIGNLVYAKCALVNIDTTGLTSAATLFVQGLPYISVDTAAASRDVGSCVLSGGVTFTGFVVASAPDKTAAVRFVETASGVSFDYLDVSEFNSGTADIYFSVTYRAA
jgi:hypothetical protein